jgi:hypothetical protein
MRLILPLLTLLTVAIGLACNNAAGPIAVKGEPAKPQSQTPAPKAESSTPAPKVDSHGHADEAPRINLADAKKDFDAGTAVFVDTRDATSFQTLRIKGAINVSLQSVDTRWQEIPKGKKIIAYCS